VKDYAFILIIAAAVTYLLTPVVRRLAFAIGAAPAPRERDVHTTPVPRLGGLAMFAGLVAGLAVAYRLTFTQEAFPTGPTGSHTIIGLIGAAGLLVAIGIVDDRFGMSPVSKLAGQVAAGGILAWSGAAVVWLPWPGGQKLMLEPDLAYTVTILLIVITINAVNFIDGLDGLAAGVVGIGALAYLFYSYTLTNSVGVLSQSISAVTSAVLAGMCIGFLPHNFHPARIFMGDTGSMLIGMMLAYAPIQSFASLDPNVLTYYNSSTLHPINRFPTFLPLILPIAIWLIPYADLLLAVIRRTAAGQSPFAADRKHLHHRLQSLGHSHRRTVLLMYLWTALFAGGLVGLSQLHISLVWLVLVTVFMVVALLVATMPWLRPWRRRARVRAALAGAALSGPILPRTVLNDTAARERSAETAEAAHEPAADLPPRRAARRGAGA
jgi:UDP-GlcNAc:undecaprenyl-phosphate GlcNAc-1-phosphate transferase